MKLTKTQARCLKEVANYEFYPSSLMPKTREALQKLELVEGKRPNKYRSEVFSLTDLGKKVLAEIAA